MPSPNHCSAPLPQTGPTVRPRLSSAPAAPWTRPCSCFPAAPLTSELERRVAQADADRAGHQHRDEDRQRVRQRAAAPADGREDQSDGERPLLAERAHDRPDEPALHDDAEKAEGAASR